MKLSVRYESGFKKAYKRACKRGLNIALLHEVVEKLAEGQALGTRYRDHRLLDSRRYRDVRECHIQPDWLLIYRIDQAELVLILIDTGTHSDLFNK